METDTDKTTFLKIAQAGIRLSKLSPVLANVSTDLKNLSQDQAQMENGFLKQLQQMIQTIDGSVLQLTDSSQGIGKITKLIQNIAVQMKILSLNASIEAARAGHTGNAFGVVAKSIHELSSEAKQATTEVESKLQEINDQIGQTVQIVGTNSGDNTVNTPFLAGKNAGPPDSQIDLHQIGITMEQIASVAANQSELASELNHIADEIRVFSEDLLMAVGILRFQVHEQIRELMNNLVETCEKYASDRYRLEQYLTEQINQHKIFEPLYVTDTKGKQISANIKPDNIDTSAYGKDWSSRPWFIGAIDAEEVFVTNIYRSVASDSFCFTASTRLFDARQDWIGILAADVNFERLL